MKSDGNVTRNSAYSRNGIGFPPEIRTPSTREKSTLGSLIGLHWSRRWWAKLFRISRFNLDHDLDQSDLRMHVILTLRHCLLTFISRKQRLPDTALRRQICSTTITTWRPRRSTQLTAATITFSHSWWKKRGRWEEGTPLPPPSTPLAELWAPWVCPWRPSGRRRPLMPPPPEGSAAGVGVVRVRLCRDWTRWACVRASTR